MPRFALRFLGSRGGAPQGYFTGASVALEPGAVFVVPPGGISLGRRAQAGIRVASSVVAPRHVVFRPTAAGLEVEDRNSTNGTRVRNEPVQRGLAQARDRIVVADSFHFEVVELEDLPEPALESAPALDDSRPEAKGAPAGLSSLAAVTILGAVASLLACRGEGRPNPPAAGEPASVNPPDAPPVRTASSVLLSAVSSVPEPPEAHVQGACRSDGDCTLTSFAGCCSCCPCTLPRAIPVVEDTAARDACATKSCSARCESSAVDCVACRDPAKEGLRARCIDARCSLVETKSPR